MKKFRTAWLTTNRSCNNNCNWCYAKNTLKTKTMMDLETAKLAVDELKRRGVKKIVLIGGEPTIYPHFFELSKYIADSGIKVSVASNGRKFADKEFAIKAKEAGIKNIDISIKAITEKEYHDNTQAYGLAEMLKGYHNLKDIGVRVSTSYVIVDDDKVRFKEFVDFLEKENITSVFVQFEKPTLSLTETYEIMSLDKMGAFVAYVYECLSKTNIDYTLEISFPICLVDEEVWDALVREKRVTNCCHVPSGTGINLDEKFRVLPCNHFAEFPFAETPIDFKSKTSIDEFYETKIVKDFRKTARVYPAIKCQTCDKWNICGGGCITRWFTEDLNKYIK